MRVHYFQHVSFEGPAYIAKWLTADGHTISKTCFYETGYEIPELETIDALVIMGGPMSVYDDAIYPWLTAEKVFISRAMQAGKKVIGVCLGAQLIALCGGATVKKAPHREIGWFPVYATQAPGTPAWFSTLLADNPVVLHWHGDQFDIPAGAINLASTTANQNQAFMIGDHILGLQFHAEMTADSLTGLVMHCREELQPSMYIQSEELILASHQPYEKAHQLISVMLENILR